jgi:hypothetical protein
MNYTSNHATQELTASLQALNSRRTEPKVVQQEFPRALAASDVVFSREVKTFIDGRRSYAEKTRNISIGQY